MNDPSDNIHIGVQAEVIHGDVHIYEVAPDATPEAKFRVGVNYLMGRMPLQALNLINDAATRGHDTWELRFYRLVALLSGRTMRQFSQDEVATLDEARRGWPPGPRNQWTQGVEIISRLIDLMISPVDEADVNVEVIIKDFKTLSVEPREMILQHLQVFLHGALDERMWDLELQDAKDNRRVRDRQERVWMFFEPKPAGPRVREPVPSQVTQTDRAIAIVSTVILTASACYIGWELLWHVNLWGLAAFAAAVVSARVCVPSGLEWHDLANRRRRMDSRYLPPEPRRGPRSSDRFAAGVDGLFRHYWETWVPDGADPSAWLVATSGVRSYLRNEIVEIYREQRVDADQVAWLIRHRHEEVRRDFRDGKLWAYREQFRVRTITKLAFVCGLFIFLLSMVGVVAAMTAEPLGGAVAITVAVLSGWLAARGWAGIALERRRATADEAEQDRRKASTNAAFDKWVERLSDRPEDLEMAGWLERDRKILLDLAMRHYQVPRSRLIAHAFIEAPGLNYKRARVLRGPWRYSAYRIRVFLLTDDGVHQVEADLNFEDSRYQERERISFSYTAITAVTATVDKRTKRTFDLGLGNGQSIKVAVTDPATNLVQEGEDEDAVSEAQWDATSLANTLRVLEGVAAGGQEWVKSRHRPHGELLLTRRDASRIFGAALPLETDWLGQDGGGAL